MKMKKIRFLTIMLFVFLLLNAFDAALSDEVVVAFEKKEYSVLLGSNEKIVPVIQGTKAKGNFSYLSSDETVAIVKNGQVKGLSLGDTIISCSGKIDEITYECSYILHVLQPVTEIIVPEKEMIVPSGAQLREMPYTVLPENAENKDIDIIYNGKKVDLYEGNIFPGSSVAMNRTYTFMAKDGSKTSAKFKYIVPKVAWFSIDNNTIVDSPEGIDFYYVPTFDTSSIVFTVYDHGDKFIKSEHKFMNNAVLHELLKDEPFDLDYDKNATKPTYIHVIPLKAGKGTFSVIVNGRKASVTINVSRSAVYENIKYEELIKKEEKNKSLRFQIAGIVYVVEESGVYIAFNGDETKLAFIEVPESMDKTAFTVGKSVTIKGIYKGTSEYKTETGLKRTIPVFNAEKIE